MVCKDCVNRTEFGAEAFGKNGHYASHARCFVWGCETCRDSCGCKFHETDPAKRVSDTNAPEYEMQVNVHDFKASFGTCQILTAYAKGDWYRGCRFDIRCGCGAYSQPSWWGGQTYETEQKAINAELDLLMHYVKGQENAEKYIEFLKACKFETRQLDLF